MQAVVVYLNGQYLDYQDARVPVDERGLQFADGVYDAGLIYHGRFVDLDDHLARLERSAAGIELQLPMARRELREVAEELLRRAQSPDFALIYLQVTRGVAPRDHKFPVGATPTVIAYVMPATFDAKAFEEGAKVVTEPDLRWLRCDLKSISILANCLARQHAAVKGAKEAILVRAGVGVTEGTLSNIWLVRGGTIVTAPASTFILGGITRSVVLRLATQAQIPVEERFASPKELMAADEVFMTNSLSHVTPIVEVDGVAVGTGIPGPVTRRLQELYLARLETLVSEAV